MGEDGPVTPIDGDGGGDRVLEALDEIVAAARANIVDWVGLMDRVERVRELRAQGVAYTEMAPDPGSRPIIDVVAGNQERLTTAAAQFRRALARQLIDEGWSTGEIARVFGVSRQRVSALLKTGFGATTVAAEPRGDTSNLPI